MNFLSEPCGVLVATARQAALLRRDRLGWRPWLRFADGYGEDSALAAMLRRWPAAIPVYLLLDDGSESFRVETVARTGRRDRKLLLRRIRQKAFADCPLVRVKALADKVHMSALNAGNEQCLKLLAETGVGIAGIYTPSLLLQRLAASRGWLRQHPHLLLLSLHAISGLRQTAFSNGETLFSRCIAMDNGAWPEADVIRAELDRVLSYWRQHGGASDGKLMLHMPEQAAAAVRPALEGHVAADAIMQCGYNGHDMHPACDAVLARQLACGLTRGEGYPVPARNARRGAERAVPLTRAALLASSLAALLLASVVPRTNALLHAAAELDGSARRDHAILAHMPGTSDKVAQLEPLLGAAEAITGGNPGPGQMLRWLKRAKVYGDPILQVRDMDWSYSGEAQQLRLALLPANGVGMAGAITRLERLVATLRATKPQGYTATVENEPAALRDDGAGGNSMVISLRLEPGQDS